MQLNHVEEMARTLSEEDIQLLGIEFEKVFRRLNREAREEKAVWMSRTAALAELGVTSYSTLKKLVLAGIIRANNAGRGRKIEYRRSDILEYKNNKMKYAAQLKSIE